MLRLRLLVVWHVCAKNYALNVLAAYVVAVGHLPTLRRDERRIVAASARRSRTPSRQLRRGGACAYRGHRRSP
jgi:hypothetical protein